MHVVCFANQKGGTAKSTTCVNVAAEIGKVSSVTVVDLDPQASATSFLGVKADGRAMVNTFRRGSPLPVVKTDWPGVSVVPGTEALTEIEREGNPKHRDHLARCIRGVHTAWVLLDVGPSLGALTLAALRVSDGVVIVTEATAASLAGVPRIAETIDAARTINKRLKVVGVLATRVKRTRHAAEVLSILRREHKRLMLPVEIPDTVAVQDAGSMGVPVATYMPSNPAAVAYAEVTREIMRRVGR